MKNSIRLLRGNEAMRGLQVVYVAEGYTAQEAALFNAQADKLAAGLLTSTDMSYMDDSDYAFSDMAWDHLDSADRSYAIIVADMTHVPEW